jgi:hypothetical protein
MNQLKLKLEFDKEMRNTYFEAKEKCDYNATRFWQMIQEHGGVETARRLLSTETIFHSGLADLWMCKKLDISVEALVLKYKYRPLFTDNLRNIAAQRLKEYHFDLGAWTKKQGSRNSKQNF